MPKGKMGPACTITECSVTQKAPLWAILGELDEHLATLGRTLEELYKTLSPIMVAEEPDSTCMKEANRAGSAITSDIEGKINVVDSFIDRAHEIKNRLEI